MVLQANFTEKIPAHNGYVDSLRNFKLEVEHGHLIRRIGTCRSWLADALPASTEEVHLHNEDYSNWLLPIVFIIFSATQEVLREKKLQLPNLESFSPTRHEWAPFLGPAARLQRQMFQAGSRAMHVNSLKKTIMSWEPRRGYEVADMRKWTRESSTEDFKPKCV